MLEAIAHHLNFDLEAVVAAQTPESLAAGTSATSAVPSHAASSTVAANTTADSTDTSELPPPKRPRLDSQGASTSITQSLTTLSSKDFPPAEFNLRLANTEGFQLFTLPQSAVNLSFIQRQGRELQLMLKHPDSLLKENAAVSVPLLCYILMTIGCMPVSLMTGPLLGKLFEKLTGQQLSSVRVATDKDIQRLSDSNMCTMVKVWIRDLCRFISIGTQMRESLDMAAKCFEEYSIRCLVDGDIDTVYDEDSTIAMDMLKMNEFNSRLILGIHQDDLPKLYIYLPHMMVGDLGGDMIRLLKQASYSLINRVD
ncbi:hypothetical protein GGI17_005405 [Coemansia sp. S146]|nr:hypothetical protein GGI17_005405 [Coemansia sp. S146]